MISNINVCVTGMVEMYTGSCVVSTSWWMVPLLYMSTDNLAKSGWYDILFKHSDIVHYKSITLQVISLASDSKRCILSFDWTQKGTAIRHQLHQKGTEQKVYIT